MTLILKHYRAVWETTTFTVQAPDGLDSDALQEWVLDNFEEERIDALDNGTARIETGASVESMDVNCHCLDDAGHILFCC